MAILWTGERARIEGVYKVEREGEEARFQKCGIGNRRLLWHGTRVGNITSILHRGLVAAPLDANQTGERFGQVCGQLHTEKPVREVTSL